MHVVLDNLNTHKKCDRWLKKHPNVVLAMSRRRGRSWRNRIETWFSILQGQSLNGASFTAVEQLQEHIDALHLSLQRDSHAIRMDQEEGLPAAV